MLDVLYLNKPYCCVQSIFYSLGRDCRSDTCEEKLLQHWNNVESGVMERQLDAILETFREKNIFRPKLFLVSCFSI